ncbi:hypothetical protein C0J52_26444 [Blattella germanica]|nr:hypothetical protein C0J52_26444 [Blattella germanica]
MKGSSLFLAIYIMTSLTESEEEEGDISMKEKKSSLALCKVQQEGEIANNLRESRLLHEAGELLYLAIIIRRVQSARIFRHLEGSGENRTIASDNTKAPKVLENNTWRIKSNSEINQILGGEDLMRYIKSMRLRWIGHVEGMEDGKMPKRLMHNDIMGVRKRSTPICQGMFNLEFHSLPNSCLSFKKLKQGSSERTKHLIGRKLDEKKFKLLKVPEECFL